MSEINPVEQYFLQKTSEATYGLWNAILTINGILLSAFSLVIAFSSKFNIALTTTLVSFCCLSMLLILWNYISTKQHYLKIGKRLSSPEYELSEDGKKSDINSSYRKHKFNIYREIVALGFLLVEIFLVALIVYNVKSTT